jgi:hypothetical protein
VAKNGSAIFERDKEIGYTAIPTSNLENVAVPDAENSSPYYHTIRISCSRHLLYFECANSGTHLETSQCKGWRTKMVYV